MIKVFSKEKIQAADAFTIENEPISSINLMERAAKNAFEKLFDKILEKTEKRMFHLFCGPGNNGGDGLVIARLLAEQNYPHQLYVLEIGSDFAPDFKSNLKKYKKLNQKIIFLNESDKSFKIEEDSIVIDAIFGTGLSRKVEGFAASIIKQLNQTKCLRISIDMPSGLFAEDNANNDTTPIFRADYTLSFQFPKLAFFFPNNHGFVGQWFIIDIGLLAEFIKANDPKVYFLQQQDILQMLPPIKTFAHKGTNGSALILAGHKGMLGAAILAARACLRSGVGLLKMQLPKIAVQLMQAAVPEAIIEIDEEEDVLSEWKRDVNCDALGIGPGIGKNEKTQQLLKLIIQESAQPMVLDADALNILAENKTWLSFLSPFSILTPHPGEFKRLAGDWESDYQRYQLALDFTVKHQVFLLLKGHFSMLVTPKGQVFFNSTGNAGMAKGGSGDVLTGIITSFLAQGINPQEAAILGMYIHGLAGDIAAEEKGMRSMLPSDIIDSLPAAFKVIEEE